jgi:hypothetical protein
MRFAPLALFAAWPSLLHAAPPDAAPPAGEEAEHCPKPEPDQEKVGARDPLEGTREPPIDSDVIPHRTGFAIALRTGWAIPQGDVEKGVSLAESVVGAVPFWLDLGYRATDQLLFGVYMQYAHVFVRDCAGPSGCNASDVRFGFQAQWHFGAREAIDHWVGIGTGFEIYDEDVGDTSRRLAGYELVNLQAGEDLSLGRRFGLGPFVSISLGKFTTVQRFASDDSAPIGADVAATGLHTWVVIGLRFSFGA